MVVIRVEPHMDTDVELPHGYSYLVEMDGAAQTLQLANAIGEAKLFENKEDAVSFWNSHMVQLDNPPPVTVSLEIPVLH